MNHITMNNTMIPYEFGFWGCMNSNNSTSLLNANGAIMDGYSTVRWNFILIELIFNNLSSY